LERTRKKRKKRTTFANKKIVLKNRGEIMLSAFGGNKNGKVQEKAAIEPGMGPNETRTKGSRRSETMKKNGEKKPGLVGTPWPRVREKRTGVSTCTIWKKKLRRRKRPQREVADSSFSVAEGKNGLGRSAEEVGEAGDRKRLDGSTIKARCINPLVFLRMTLKSVESGKKSSGIRKKTKKKKE